MRRPVSDGMLYAPRYPRAQGTEKKETCCEGKTDTDPPAASFANRRKGGTVVCCKMVCAVSERSTASAPDHLTLDEDKMFLSFKTPPHVIICINIDDLIACENGANFLRLISTRYIEAKTGAAQLITQA